MPFQADFSNAYVLGPYTLNAFCFAETTTGVDAAAEPEFAYVPVVVTVDVPTTPDTPPTQAPVAAPISAAPAFTG